PLEQQHLRRLVGVEKSHRSATAPVLQALCRPRIAMTWALHLQHRVTAVRSMYGSNPADVATGLERGADLQLPCSRRVSDKTGQPRQPVASDIAERRDDD